jgi:hypothetical protein
VEDFRAATRRAAIHPRRKTAPATLVSVMSFECY